MYVYVCVVRSCLFLYINMLPQYIYSYVLYVQLLYIGMYVCMGGVTNIPPE